MLVFFTCLGYIIASAIMNSVLHSAWASRSDDDATTTIHVLSMVWPLTLVLSLSVALFTRIRGLFTSAR